MAVPKKRTAKSKRNMRRSHHALLLPVLTPCPRCHQMKLPHLACLNCGTYRERVVIDVTRQTDKKERKAKARARAGAGQ